MKFCPNCQTQYTDDTLQFCYEDGAVLLDFFSSGSWQPSLESTGEIETVVRLKKTPSFLEQSQVTQVAKLLPKENKSNLPIFFIASAACLLFVGALGIWFLLSAGSLSASGSSDSSSNNASNSSNKAPLLSNASSNNASSPSASPTLGNNPSNSEARLPSRNPTPIKVQNNTPSKRISVGGETFKACNYLLGSGLYGKWMQLGGEKGLLGCPIMNETETPRSPKGTTGRMTQFNKGDGGYIIWHGSGRYSGTSYEVSGCMFKLYSSLGATRSWLGFPVKDGYSTPNGARQDFEGGYILWNSKTYKCQAFRN